ncbi:unnamed protein product [Amoebophrya sp. A120]|nr:unnamed protein product [Amoebophrya sp. A120]|eukprot:GSA120T00016610001.1
MKRTEEQALLCSTTSDHTMANNIAASVEPALKRSRILCCNCGMQMESNSTGMCLNCMQSTMDITDHLSRSIVLPHCRECNRYLGDSRWMTCDRESKELLALCLKKIKGLKKVKLTDAAFIWTEEHSKRLKVKLTLQKEIDGCNGAALQQELVIEFVIHNHQCEDCKRSYTPHTWKAAVQVRQRVDHRRTLMHLEQLILKHDAHEKLLFLQQSPEGLDFHFLSQSHAHRFADFVRQWAPCRHENSRTLVSHDTKNNKYNYKYTIMVYLAPICKDDLVFLPKKLAANYGLAGQLLLVHKVGTQISLVDPTSLLGCDVAGVKYWENPCETVMTRKHLTEFVVLDKEPLDYSQRNVSVKNRGPRAHMQLADIEVARVCDLGVNDERIRVRSHLGHLVEAGDHVLGYDMRTVNVSGEDDDKIGSVKPENLPDVILVKKKYLASTARRTAKRKFQLRRLAVQDQDMARGARAAKMATEERDFEQFQQDIEEDEDLRKDVKLYRRGKLLKNQQDSGRNKFDALGEQANSGETGEENDDTEKQTAADSDEDDELPDVPIDELNELMGALCVTGGGAANDDEEGDELSDDPDL